jgi:limonene-1,2-epoxide hydrolase
MTELKRRTFLASAGVAAFTSFVPVTLGAETTEAEQANARLVADFCAAWSTRDLRRILPLLAEDCVYRMTETTPAVAGHAGVTERLGSWLQTSAQVEFRILETYAKGPMVVTHRIDRFVSSTRPLTWEGVGVFFVKDAKIKEWSDYTIRVER